MKRSHTFLLRALPATASLLLLFSCNSDRPTTGDTTRRAIDPPLAATVPFRDFEIDVAGGDTIRLPEGTSIYIPSGIFVDAAGVPVKGAVQLHYRAFYTPGEIIASGITMLYDTAGQQEDFTSAGMFQLYGTQDGRPVAIAPGKSIGMDFASSYNDANYNFYELDTTSAKWSFVSTSTADTNRIRQEIEKALARLSARPVEPIAYNPSRPVIDIDVDLADHPELAGYNGILWQYAGSGTNPESSPWVYSTDWTSANLVMRDSNTCMYNMTLSNADKRFSTNVFPVLKGDNYTDAVAAFKTRMQAFDASEKVRQEKRQQLAQSQAFDRKLGVTRFGTFNLDIFNIFGIPKRIKAIFHFSDPEFDNAKERVRVYVCTADGRLVSRYGALDEPMINYIPDRNTMMIAVLLGTNKAAILGNGEFNEAVSAQGDAKGVFTLRPTTQPVANDKDLDALISKL